MMYRHNTLEMFVLSDRRNSNVFFISSSDIIE